MFSIFNRKKVTIHSIVIPDLEWVKARDTNSVIQWINPEQTIAVSINFFDIPPDIPTISNLEILRGFYRNALSNINGGLIQMDILNIHNIPAAKTIFKIPQESSGITYLASLTIPFETCSFVIKVQCTEIDPTGMRDSLVANELLTQGNLKIGDNGFENWFSDPYDGNYKTGTLMNISEQEIYDSRFPNHPLTQARILIGKVEKNLIFNTEIEKIKRLNR